MLRSKRDTKFQKKEIKMPENPKICKTKKSSSTIIKPPVKAQKSMNKVCLMSKLTEDCTLIEEYALTKGIKIVYPSLKFKME